MKSALTEKWIVCRICLQQPNEQMQTIFNTDATKDMTQMILECGGVPIKQFDHYPDKICSKCLKYLRVSYKFRQTCQRSYKHLSRFIAPVVVDKNVDVPEDLTGEAEESNPGVIEEFAADASLVFDDEDNSKAELMLHLDPDINVKEEFSEGEDDVVDIYTPMEDDFEQIEEFDSFDREASNPSDVVEFLDEIADDISSNDEEYMPIRKGLKKRGPRGRQIKQEGIEKKLLNRPSTSRASGLLSGRVEKPKRQPRSKDDKLRTFICDVCGNVYPTQGRLKEHIKSHNGVKPYECEICGYAFAQNQQLARHMNTHTGNRPYKCNYCPSAFADLSTRNKHHRIHTNERPYVCDVCGKAFSYTNTLKFHKMIHTGEKPFVCDICGKGFHQAYKLRNHKVTHEKRGHIAAVKIELESNEGFQEVHEAAAQLLEI